MGVSQNEGCGKRKFCLRGLFRGMFWGSVSPKSNFPALLEIGHPIKIQTHMTAALQNQDIVEEQLLYKINILLQNRTQTAITLAQKEKVR